jgi:hypothetical protein
LDVYATIAGLLASQKKVSEANKGTASAGWPIPATPRSFGKEVFEIPVEDEAELLEPDVEAWVDLLRASFRDPDAVAAHGAAAAWAAQAWSWDAAAEKIITRCRAITAQNGK